MKAVVLLSGGLDSFVTMALALRKKRDVYPLAFSYGQSNSIEFEYAEAQLAYFKEQRFTDEVRPLKVIRIEGLVTRDQSYVPNRNAIMLNLAAAYAESVEALEVWTGLIGNERTNKLSSYIPDSSKKFVAQINRLLSFSTKDVQVEVVAPLIGMSKTQVMEKGAKMKLPLGMSWSCYRPTDGRPCYVCSACISRTVACAQSGQASAMTPQLGVDASREIRNLKLVEPL